MNKKKEKKKEEGKKDKLPLQQESRNKKQRQRQNYEADRCARPGFLKPSRGQVLESLFLIFPRWIAVFSPSFMILKTRNFCSTDVSVPDP